MANATNPNQIRWTLTIKQRESGVKTIGRTCHKTLDVRKLQPEMVAVMKEIIAKYES